MTDNELEAKKYRLAVIENIGILATIILCTASVAYFAQSEKGLWSLLLVFASVNTSLREPCVCEGDDEYEGEPVLSEKVA